ncbi:MAG: murein transglycosylase A [Desulfovibrio sp.]|jgi:membrane-bound lytic murein transglycosylase A|nr:murein transglycosylase A [Desulfovibrio sp.]
MARPGGMVRAALAAAALAVATISLGGCALLDQLPRSSPGRPEYAVRKARTGTPAGARQDSRPSARPESRPDSGQDQRDAGADEYRREEPRQSAPSRMDDAEEGGSVFRPRSGAQARALAWQLDPATQSLPAYAALAGPLRHSVEYLSRQRPDSPALVQPGGSLSYGQLADTARELLDLLPRLDSDPGLLAEYFVWYELSPSPLVTGYYSPEVPASLTRQPGYEVPLYSRPPDLRQASEEEQRQGRPKVYRAEGGAITPYYDRKAIDLDGVLAGQGLEIAWVKSPLDAFLLQTEGAGTLLLPDGTRRTVQFKAGNGQEFTGMGQLLLASGALPRERLTRTDIRQWCEANPERARELMALNRSYVFFELRSGASVGAMEKPLTALVSLATDPSLLPLGSVAVLEMALPGRNGGPPAGIHGLVLAQDTGSDIRGHRLDLYLGEGEKAERQEAGLRASGGLHLLVSKNALRGIAYTRGQ